MLCHNSFKNIVDGKMKLKKWEFVKQDPPIFSTANILFLISTFSETSTLPFLSFLVNIDEFVNAVDHDTFLLPEMFTPISA